MIRFLFLFFCFRAEAFDLYPEYQGISERELQRIESPSQLDFEYQSAWNSYALPVSGEPVWSENSNAFETTAGSINNTHFLIQQRLKLEKDFSDSLTFKFVHFIQQDLESDQSRAIFELEYDLLSWLSIAAYGQPALYKRENDLGFALILRPNQNWENRFFLTRHDFTRADHNDQEDRFLNGKPDSFGFITQWKNDRLFSRIGLRNDPHVIWRRPQEARDFRYTKEIYFAESIYKFNPLQASSLEAQYDTQLKGQSPLVGNGLTEESKRIDRTLLRFAYQHGLGLKVFNYELSLMSAHRKWRDELRRVFQHSNILPGFTTRIRTLQREENFDFLQLGVEANAFRAAGDFELVAPNQKSEKLNLRMQVAYEFGLREDTKLFIAANLDLDEWRRIPTFDGGNARLSMSF